MATVSTYFPEKIRAYIGSERVVAFIDDINKRAGLYDPSIVPYVIYLLLSHEIPPEKFDNTLMEQFGFPELEAKAIAKEVRNTIFMPIYRQLLEVGIDVNDMDVLDAISLEEYRKKYLEEEPAEIPQKEKTISFESFGAAATEEKTIPVQKIEEKTAEDVPLIIHKEAQPEATRSKFPRLGFSPFTLFKEKTKEQKREVKANVIAPEEKRVVHYSELRTELTPFASGEEIINLETLAPEIPKPPTPMPPLPKPPAPVSAEPLKPKSEPASAPTVKTQKTPFSLFTAFRKKSKEVETPKSDPLAPAPTAPAPKAQTKHAFFGLFGKMKKEESVPISMVPQTQKENIELPKTQAREEEKKPKKPFFGLFGKNETEKPPQKTTEERIQKIEPSANNQPKIEGNIIDLR